MHKKWLINGTSNGIGRVMTEKLLSQGDFVFATLRNTETLNDLQKKYPEQLKVEHLELTDKIEIQSAVDAAFNEFGKIDVVVSNAGYGLFGAVEELTDEMISHQIEVNLLGAIRFIKAVIPHFRIQQGGHIIQVSSEGGQYAYPGFSLYHASKWGIEGFVESIAKDLEPFRIYCTIAQPGPTGTSFGTSIKTGKSMKVYEGTPVHELLKLIEEDSFGELDDVNDVSQAIIESTKKDLPPLRLTIGNVANTNVKAALTERLNWLSSK
ncbi:SDR family oxidoreductase [Zunongwangia sp. HGR-M22]|uniref:SDR family oxidoreductase n=1 Tax=Zunongwangia sp. HGR-M22 TaxID=3015168 RepID=UPI0022DE236B|nr:SDR family oxidoreductase [Zunongwangia sp. HGR-M22]WBL24318.1 SDR family oxidoreductase [Zunongwangia sp. HGR-M22]